MTENSVPLFDFHTHNGQAEAGCAVINVPDRVLFLPCSFKPEEGKLYSAGLHPMLDGDWEKAWQGLRELVDQPAVAALGECGLDKRSGHPMEEQCRYLALQMELADRLHLPLILHCVRAWDELLVVHRAHPSPMPRVVHGFRGKPELAAELLKEGFFLSFGPTYNAEALRLCPQAKRFMETDDSGWTISQVAEKQAGDL